MCPPPQETTEVATTHMEYMEMIAFVERHVPPIPERLLD
jgi:hypothetical protein